jgi:dephospho-CoA kinase
MYDSHGKVYRERMANLVFNDLSALEELNSIVHPKVNEAFDEWCLQHEKEPYVIKEAAILLESGTYHDLDKIISVFAPKESRMERVMKRDKVSENDVKKRMRFQYSDEERNELADFIIMNEDGVDLLIQVMELHEILLNEKKKW